MDNVFEYKPENKFAGTFPVVTEIVTAGEDILKMSPITIKNGKAYMITAAELTGVVSLADGDSNESATTTETTTAETTIDVVGLAVEDAKTDAETLYYATGEFQIDSVVLAEGITIDAIKPILAKIIFI